MMGQRRANELDAFLNHNQAATRMVSPRNQPFNNLTNNFFSNGYHQDHSKYDRNISPNAPPNARKPMISPVRSPRNMPVPLNPTQRGWPKHQDTERTREFYCSNENHKNRKAEYLIHIEDEDMYYCGICATQAASQGFTVNRINTPPAHPVVRKQKVIPHCADYLNNKRYHEITELMGNIITMENQCRKNDPKTVREHYIQQEQLLNDFYDEQIEVIQKMRRDHLNDLKEEQANNLHNCEKNYPLIRQLISDLNVAWDDIEESLKVIVEPLIEEDTYNNAINAYRLKFHSIHQNICQINANFTTYDLRSLNAKIKTFENKLLELWIEDSLQEQPTKKRIPEKVPKAGSYPTSIKIIQGNTLKNVHQNLPKSTSQLNMERQDPFRNLFPEEDEQQRLPQASPQFKAF